MHETVTSVSKREQFLFDSAAAIAVLSNEDLRRSGATSVADALRLVPGMNVASVNSRQWAISARGFNGINANNLLVLVDGRAVYSPLFAGVYWDLEQAILEDVDRIEVIRGPGATVWGANAVNGVVNVVSRSAMDTQGGLLYGSVGDVQETNSGVRYGGRLDAKTYYRVHAGYQSKDAYRLADGSQADDGWQGKQGGFRVDRYPNPDTQLTWQAGLTEVASDDDLTDARNINTLGRFTRRWSDRSSVEFQAYFDHTLRDEQDRVRSRSDTFDFTAQHTFGLGERNDIIWGLGYRLVDLAIDQTSPVLEIRNDEVKTDLFSMFVQNEFRLVPDKVTLTAGVKIEHNDYTGLEIQPSICGVFKPTAQQTIWTAVSRAVRTPSAIEGEQVFSIPIGGPTPRPGGVGLYIPRLVGDSDCDSEVLWAYELGYRVQATDRISVDVAVFYNDYEDLISFGEISEYNLGFPFGVADVPFSNVLSGETYGGELSVTVTPTDSWRLIASYSLLLADIRGPASSSASAQSIERSAARHQVVLRSSHDITRRLGVDVQVRYVDTVQSVPSYITADLRLAYQMTNQLELSLVGQNLLDDRHPEQGPAAAIVPTEVPRGFYGKITWRF